MTYDIKTIVQQAKERIHREQWLKQRFPNITPEEIQKCLNGWCEQ